MKNILLLVFLIIIACKKTISYNYPDNQDYDRKSRGGLLLNKDVVLIGDKKDDKKDDKIEEDKFLKKQDNRLWSASVSVISSLFPIAAIDNSSSIIATEWYQENVDSKFRIKINVFLRGVEIKEENLRISIFRQRKDEKGDWQIDISQSEGDVLTIKLLKDKILKEAEIKK